MSVRAPASSYRNVWIWNGTRKFSKMGRAAGFSRPSPLSHHLPSPMLTVSINPPKFDWNSWEHASCIAQGLSVDSDCFLSSSLPFSLQFWFKQLSLSGLNAEREVLNDTIIYLVMLKKKTHKKLHCRYQCSLSLFPPFASSKKKKGGDLLC